MAQQTLQSQTDARPSLTNLPPFELKPGKIQLDLLIRRVGSVGLLLNPIFSYFFLWAPILLLVIFSFNDSRGVSVWRGFTWRWYVNIFNNTVGTDASFSTGLMLQAFWASIWIGLATTVISTIIGTMAALALERTEFPGKRILDGVLYLPVVIPEITQGISLAVYFKTVFDYVNNLTGTDIKQGAITVIIGHVVFTISYVVIVVRARLASMNPRLEEAASDLGANPWRTFWRVTFPLLFPGILAGALLGFTVSLDDYVVTFFTRGAGTNTLPIFVYGLLKTTISPEINAISTILLVISTVLIGVSLAFQGRSTAER
ncbi:MAG: ABC transporter permease [Phototrophicaceae bacterium]|jgi:spermidine/putrescine transport system permease protein